MKKKKKKVHTSELQEKHAAEKHNAFYGNASLTVIAVLVLISN